jgi:hypothetical protein
VRYFGFYADCGYLVGRGVPVTDLRLGRPLDTATKQAAVGYLAHGKHLTVVMGIERDPFDRTQQVMGGHSTQTDGVWCWPKMAVVLVHRYDLEVPDELLAHMRTCSFRPPALTIEELRSIFTDVRSDLFSPDQLA